MSLLTAAGPSARMFQLRSLAIVSAVALGLAASPAEAQKVLRHQFRKGAPRDLVIGQDMKMSMEFGGQNIKVEMKQDIQFRNEVADIAADGSARVRQRVTRIKMNSSGLPGANFSFDSASDEEPQGLATLVAPIFRAMLAGDVQLTMTPQGEIREVELPREMIDAAGRAGNLPGVSDLLSEANLTQMMKQSGVQFPEGPVQKGQSWTETAETDSAAAGKQVIKTTYTYLGEEEVDGRKLDKIGVALDMQFLGGPEEVQLKVTEQKSNGVLYFDNTAGELVKSTMDQMMKMDIQAGGNAIQQVLETKVNVNQRPAQ